MPQSALERRQCENIILRKSPVILGNILFISGSSARVIQTKKQPSQAHSPRMIKHNFTMNAFKEHYHSKANTVYSWNKIIIELSC